MSTAVLMGLRDYLYSTLSPANMRWLSTELAEYAHKMETPPCRYTLEEMNAILDQAEANFAAGLGIPDEEVWREWDEQLAREEQEEHEYELAEAV